MSVNHSTMHHFADDMNLLLTGKSLKTINKLINHDLKSIVIWLRANKISLNSQKTEIILFKSPKTKITKNLNFRVKWTKN